ncbi:MAG: DUF4080 domain-containing protein [Lachnospiraceae bacterium]|nr:DUF4080 domain-containing protein [Lachnospiraceae bacterium]
MVGEGEETFRELCRYYIEYEEMDCMHYQVAGVNNESLFDKNFFVLSEISGIVYRNSLLDNQDFYLTQRTKENFSQINVTENANRNSTSSNIAEDMIYSKEQKNDIQESCIENQFITTLPRAIMNMSDIPFCYDNIENFANRIIYYESSRGCPFSCSYCLSSIDKKLRFRDLDFVKKELAFFIEKKVPQVKFVDRTFNCNHTHAMEIWRFIKEHDNGITNFHFEISADLLNEEELELISNMRVGLIQLEIGVQSTNPITISEIKRTMRFERLKEIVQKIQSFKNIHQHLDLIAGLPYEDYRTFQKSFDDVYALQPEQLQLGFLKVLKGSYMYEYAKEYGIIYHKYAPYEVLSTNWLSYDDILRLKRIEEVLEVYYNSRQYEITMQVLKTGYESAFFMFEQLGAFYEEQGYFHMSHSRIRRAEIVIEFVTKKCKDKNLPIEFIECVKESLIFDLYYRENCKSRPNWAVDAGTFKEMTRLYCKNGKQAHIEPFHYNFLEIQERLPTYCEVPQWVLFSYDKRNPLTHQAQVERIM